MNVLKHFVVLGIGALAVLYLINPTAGVIEFIPDILPVIGNLDEATAVLLLTNVLAFYGIDLTRLFGRTPRNDGPTVVQGTTTSTNKR